MTQPKKETVDKQWHIVLLIKICELPITMAAFSLDRRPYFDANYATYYE